MICSGDETTVEIILGGFDADKFKVLFGVNCVF